MFEKALQCVPLNYICSAFAQNSNSVMQDNDD